MESLSPLDKWAIEHFKEITTYEFVQQEKYLSEEIEWDALWDYNISRIDRRLLKCSCQVEALNYYGASNRKRFFVSSSSLHYLKKLGCSLNLTQGEQSAYSEDYYQCACGQVWKELFFEDMQASGRRVIPVDEIPVNF